MITRFDQWDSYLLTAFCLLLAMMPVLATAEDAFLGPHVENDQIRVLLVPHTSDQMAAFYEARGFPRSALNAIKQSCFITVHIENKSDQIIWLELKNWRFLGAKGPLIRQTRNYWNVQWNKINLARSSRSTFGWTLLPKVRNLQPGEPVGGNITIPQTREPFTIDMRFITGEHKRLDQIHVQLENIHCPQEEPDR